MRCEHCLACRNDSYEYPEYYCALGVSEDDTIEFKDGELGCRRRSADKLKKDLDVRDKDEGKAYAEMAESFVEFMEEEVQNERGVKC